MPDHTDADERVPFNLPALVGRELEYIAEAVRGGQLAGNGVFTHQCQEYLRTTYGGHRVLLTPSCTAALEMAALLCEVGPGDEVILPSFTFVSTANAFALRGATLRFVEIQPDTLNLDPRAVAAAVTDRTKVICPVHYAGVGCDMEALGRIAADAGALLIEDAAQGVGCTYRGAYLGTIGALGAYSFHETKNFGSGEGGALVINDAAFAERADILAEKGTDRTRFRLGQVDKYSWVDVGSSYYPSELTAAFLLAQLERSADITARRLTAWQRYWDGLEALQTTERLRLPTVPDDCIQNGHMFYVLLQTAAERDALLADLMARDINAVTHYVPLHGSRMGRRLGYAPGDLPVTESVAARLLRLPMYYALTAAQQKRVLGAIHAHFTA